MKDVAGIYAGDNHYLALRTDGKLGARGLNRSGQCDVAEWKLFDSVEQLRSFRQRQIDELTEEIKSLEQEADALTGLFSGVKRRKIEEQILEDYESVKVLRYILEGPRLPKKQ